MPWKPVGAIETYRLVHAFQGWDSDCGVSEVVMK